MAAAHRSRRAGEMDEGPSSVDLDMFGHESAVCPNCGHEVWDDSQYCGHCGTYFLVPAPERRAGRPWLRVALLVLAAISMVVLAFCTVPDGGGPRPL